MLIFCVYVNNPDVNNSLKSRNYCLIQLHINMKKLVENC